MDGTDSRMSMLSAVEGWVLALSQIVRHVCEKRVATEKSATVHL